MLMKYTQMHFYLTAVGAYESYSGRVRSLAQSLSGGGWSAATPPPPADAAMTRKSPGVSVNVVACQAASSCTGSEFYTAGSGVYDGSIDRHPFGRHVDSGEGSLTARDLGHDHSPKETAEFNSLVCPTPGNCVAVGSYLGQANSS
jgi:hypothetical protein